MTSRQPLIVTGQRTARIVSLAGDGSCVVALQGDGGQLPAWLTAATASATVGQACFVQRTGLGVSGSWQVVGFPTPNATGPQLIANPNFGLTNPDGSAAAWDTTASFGAATWAVNPTGAADGTACMSVTLTADTPEATAVMRSQQPFFVDAMTKYTLSLDVMASNASANAQMTVTAITDSDPNDLPDGPGANAVPLILLNPISGSWQTLTATLQPITGSTVAIIQISVTAPDMSAVSVFLDNLSLKANLS